ncbi:MAG: ester cyclase [Chloroflexota bacterium]|nr:ester cyclase [Chloroflexota bacterium]
MGVDANRNLAIRYLNDVVGGGNLALIDELVHPEAQDLSGPWPKGREGFREHVSSFRSAFDPKVSIERVIADGEYAAVYWMGKGRHVGRAFGIGPTGRPVENDFISTLRFRDGMIVQCEVLFDMLRFLVQVGCLGPWESEFIR